MKTSNEFKSELISIGIAIKESTLELLRKHNVESINITPYIVENYINTFYFYDCDKDGNGVALEVSSLKVKGDTIYVDMDTNFDDYFGEYDSTNFTTDEQANLLEMLECLFEAIKEEGLPLLKEGEYFDDYE